MAQEVTISGKQWLEIAALYAWLHVDIRADPPVNLVDHVGERISHAFQRGFERGLQEGPKRQGAHDED